MKKTILGFVVVLLVIGFAFGQDQYKKVNRFGVAPLKMGGVHGEQDLMDLFNKEAEAISVALGRQDALIKAFFAQMFNAEIWYQGFPVGTRFLSLTFRYREGIGDVGKWEWVGEKPFFGYSMVIEYDAKHYWVIVPEICGNIGLWKIEMVEKNEPIIKPKSEIREWPPRSTKNLQPEIRQFIPEQEQKAEQNPQMNFFAGAGIGGFYSCFMEYAIGEIGVKRNISDMSELLASIGVGVPVGKNRDGWYTVPIINLDLIGMFFQPIYIGAGVGFSGKMKEGQSSQLEYGPDMGFRIKNCDLFVRGRIPFKGDIRGIRGNYKVFLGVRFFF